MRRPNKKILLLMLLVILIGLYSLHSMAFNRVQVLPLGHGRLITFYNNWYEIDSCAREFQVRDYFGRAIHDGCFVEFCDEPNPNEFEIVSNKEGSVIGVLDHKLNSPLFVMCDFISGKCSPCDASEVEKQEIFEKLKWDNPELPGPDQELPSLN